MTRARATTGGRTPALRARGTLIGAVAAAVVLLAWLTPSTSSAYLARIANGTNTAASAPYFTCAGAYAADRANSLFQYPLSEASGSARSTDVGPYGNYGNYSGLMTTTTVAPIGCPRDTGGAYVLNGTSSYLIASPMIMTNPTTFSVEVWFRTTLAQGKLIGFGSSGTGSSGSYDRHIYLSAGGVLNFGIYNGQTQVISSGSGYNDGAWHHVIATLSPSAGSTLYVDGRSVASNASYVTPQNYTGYWHIGFDNLSGWPNAATPYYFSGSMRWAAVYTTALTPTQVANHYNAGRAP